jgi:Uma2 family endonuclease
MTLGKRDGMIKAPLHSIANPLPRPLALCDHRCGISSPGGPKHQRVLLKLAAALLRHSELGNLGQVLQAPCDVILSRNVIVRPDILFIERGRIGLIGKNNLWGAPDLVIEILAPHTREQDLTQKRNLYSRFGIREYWIADPDAATAEVLVWSELGYATAGICGRSDRMSSPLFPRLRLPLRKVFEPC